MANYEWADYIPDWALPVMAVLAGILGMCALAKYIGWS